MPADGEAFGCYMSALSFSVTWDYRCPFARNVHEHIVLAVDHGSDGYVTFLPISRSQTRGEAGDSDVWDDPARDSGLRALNMGVVVRDALTDSFRAVLRDLFAARHDHGADLRSDDVLRDVLR